MATPPTDDRIELTLLRSRMVTSDQIQAAKDEQARLSESGRQLPLADVLVQLHVITDAIRENVIEAAQHPNPDELERIGPFKILKKLGEGGMGAVYLAEDSEHNRQVALKVLPEKFSKQAECLSRFRREAKAATALRHKNIAVALAEGEDQGVHYYAMEYIEGDALDEIRKSELSFPMERTIDIILQVASGLQYAHNQGIVHRDIKPANIFLGNSGIVKILDMGLSKDLSEEEQSFNTQSGAVLGTAHYISPEQAKGEKTIDGRTDIYSLGATFYNLVTGRTPFQGATPALIMMKHLTEHLPNPQDVVENVPDGVVQIIRKMMAKDPDDRYRNCAELIKDLESVKAGDEPEFAALDDSKSNVMARKGKLNAALTAPFTRPPLAQAAARMREKRKSRWALAAIAAISMIALASVVWSALRDRAKPVETPPVVPTVNAAPQRVMTTAAETTLTSATTSGLQPAPNKYELIKEDFETVDLDKHRDDWRIVEHTAFSIVDVSGHGKVLRLDTSGKRPRQPQLDIPLNLKDVANRPLDGTFNAKSIAPGAPHSGASVTIYRVDSTGTIFREKGADIETSNAHWTTYRFRQPPIADAKEIFVRLEATADVGEILIDDIKLNIPVDANPSEQPQSK